MLASRRWRPACTASTLLSSGRAVLRTYSHSSRTVRIRQPQALLCLRLPPKRCQSTATRFAYPEYVTAFKNSALRNGAIGAARVATVLIVVYGTFIQAPSFYFRDDSAIWTIPACIALSFIPAITLALCFGSYVTSIRLRLPDLARRSEESLMRFAARTPPDTRVQLEFVRFAPMLQKQVATFGALRALPVNRGQFANLENLPKGIETQYEKAGWAGQVYRRYSARYYVNSAGNTSDLRGAWEKMCTQLAQPGRGAASARASPRPVSRLPPGPKAALPQQSRAKAARKPPMR